MRLLIATVLLFGMSVFGSEEYGKINEAELKTPDQSIQALIDGNQRFVSGKVLNHKYQEDQKSVAADQHPHAAVLACLDSRVAPEIILDQSLGDIFVGRVAGNVESTDMLGSLEFAAKVKGVRSIMVMGHTSCGAVIGACKDVKMGSLTSLLKEIKPAIKETKKKFPKMKEDSTEFYDHASVENVKETVSNIAKRSKILSDLVKEGKLKIVGAMYDLNTGKVTLVD